MKRTKKLSDIELSNFKSEMKKLDLCNVLDFIAVFGFDCLIDSLNAYVNSPRFDKDAAALRLYNNYHGGQS